MGPPIQALESLPHSLFPPNVWPRCWSLECKWRHCHSTFVENTFKLSKYYPAISHIWLSHANTHETPVLHLPAYTDWFGTVQGSCTSKIYLFMTYACTEVYQMRCKIVLACCCFHSHSFLFCESIRNKRGHELNKINFKKSEWKLVHSSLHSHLCSTLNTYADMGGAFCLYPAFISSIFLHFWSWAVTLETVKTVTIRPTILVRHDEEKSLEIAELFEGLSGPLVDVLIKMGSDDNIAWNRCTHFRS